MKDVVRKFEESAAVGHASSTPNPGASNSSATKVPSSSIGNVKEMGRMRHTTTKPNKGSMPKKTT